jgi:alcohol dehydrogenase
VRSLDGICAEGLEQIFGRRLDEAASGLETFLEDLGIATSHRAYGIGDGEWRAILDAALDGERGRNFIGSKEALTAALAGERRMQLQ